MSSNYHHNGNPAAAIHQENVEAAKEALMKDKRYRPGYLGGPDVKILAESNCKEDTSAANGSSIMVLAGF